MKKYAKDYENVVETDEFGFERKVTVYIGNYYDVNLDEANLKKYRRLIFLLAGLMIIGQLAAGFIANRAMYTVYVSIPYVLSLLPLYFLIDSALRLPQEKRDYKRGEVELSFIRLKTASKFMLALVGISTIGDIVYMIFFSQGFDPREMVFLAVEVLVAASAYLLLRLSRPIIVTEIAGETGQNGENQVKLSDPVD